MSVSVIKHNGVINTISEDFVEVSILSKSACSSCHAKSACSVSDVEEKTVKVYNDTLSDFSVGENVCVVMKQAKGFEALMWGYLLPFFILMLALLLSLNYTSELIAGLLSLAVLIPYYIVLYLMKDRIQKRFTFEIEK